MRNIRITAVEIEQTDEVLDKLSELKVELTQLESDYDMFGKIKDEEGLRIARNIREWKKSRNAAELIKYEITQEHKELFNQKFNQLKEEVASAKSDYEQAKQSNDPDLEFYLNKFNQKEKEFDIWTKNNSVRKISQNFYLERNIILSSINAIQEKYRSADDMQPITELYDQLFSLLRSYKNEVGYYEGSKVSEEKVQDGSKEINIAVRVKELEDKIEKFRDDLSSKTEMSTNDKNNLYNLFNQLSSMQEKVNTPDYERVLGIKKAEIRSKVVADSKNTGLTRAAIEGMVMSQLRNTEWFKDNHKIVSKYN
jgi:hypothetical protein